MLHYICTHAGKRRLVSSPYQLLEALACEEMRRPIIEEDEQSQPEESHQVPAHYIEEPVVPLEESRVADSKDITQKEDLQWQQEPAITPVPHRFAESDVQQEAGGDHVMRDMAGWETVIGISVMDADARL